MVLLKNVTPRRSVATNWRRRTPTSFTKCRIALLSIVILFPCILQLFTIISTRPLTHFPVAQAMEIVATHEWQKVGKNDTIPAGLHVKMDLSTGEKWAKIATADEDDESKMAASGSISAEISHDGALTIIENGDDNSDETAQNEKVEEFAPERDYVMMHRVMSSLPPEELKRFGGLPDLPALPSANENTTTKLTKADREAFEQNMELLWQKRQEELRKFQEENIANLPKILRERIATLKGYLVDIEGSLDKLLIEKKAREESESSDVLEISKEGDSDDDDQDIVKDILSALRDLEFQLSDVDMARDFHTLGGWPYLVALLSDDLHHVQSRGSRNPNLEKDATTFTEKGDDVLAIIDEIQSLAAMTIGTAIGNLDEFRSWALEDISFPIQQLLNQTATTSTNKNSQAVSVSALSLLTNTFLEELNLRSSQMKGMTMAVPMKDSSIHSQSRSIYKIRAIYALGSLLRGNPPAQQVFVSQLAGPDILIRNVLGTLSEVRGPIASNTMAKLDYKFASKVLALGEDLVMDVVLHHDDYVEVDEETPLEVREGYLNDGIVTANQLIAAFTTELWCDLSLRMLSVPSDVLGAQGAIAIKERALHATRALGPSCRESHIFGDWGVEEVAKVRKEINREGSGDGLEPTYRKELLELIESVLSTLK